MRAMKNVTGAFLESKYRRAIAAGDDDAITQTRDELIIFLGGFMNLPKRNASWSSLRRF